MQLLSCRNIHVLACTYAIYTQNILTLGSCVVVTMTEQLHGNSG